MQPILIVNIRKTNVKLRIILIKYFIKHNAGGNCQIEGITAATHRNAGNEITIEHLSFFAIHYI